jgi:hypothetical protein
VQRAAALRCHWLSQSLAYWVLYAGLYPFARALGQRNERPGRYSAAVSASASGHSAGK